MVYCDWRCAVVSTVYLCMHGMGPKYVHTHRSGRCLDDDVTAAPGPSYSTQVRQIYARPQADLCIWIGGWGSDSCRTPKREVVFVSVPCVRACEAVCASHPRALGPSQNPCPAPLRSGSCWRLRPGCVPVASWLRPGCVPSASRLCLACVPAASRHEMKVK